MDKNFFKKFYKDILSKVNKGNHQFGHLCGGKGGKRLQTLNLQ